MRVMRMVFFLSVVMTGCSGSSGDSGSSSDSGNRKSPQDEQDTDVEEGECAGETKLDRYGLQPELQWKFFQEVRNGLSEPAPPFEQGLIFSRIAGRFLPDSLREVSFRGFAIDARLMFFRPGTGEIRSVESSRQLRKESCLSVGSGKSQEPESFSAVHEDLPKLH